ncbi:MAG TPA: nucleoside-diphosphate kinase [Actinomycetota bacterium]
MTTQETLVIAKPDAVRRRLVGEILRRFEERGLRITGLRMMRIDQDLADRHYEEHRDKPFFGELVEFITSGPVVVARIEGEDAVAAVRELMGPTDPKDAPPGTIRGDYGEVITENLVHGSDSPENAKRELDLFFG